MPSFDPAQVIRRKGAPGPPVVRVDLRTHEDKAVTKPVVRC